MKITISGTLGSGKSTVAKMLAEKLNYKIYSTGGFMRELASSRNLTLSELTLIANKDPSIDKQIDDYQVKLGKEQDNFILEGRLGFHFVPDSIKIFLKCDEKTAAKRILKGLKEKDPSRLKEGLSEDEKSILESLRKRRASENQRYSKLYRVNQDAPKNFDIIIDTTQISPEDVCEKALAFIKNNHSRN